MYGPSPPAPGELSGGAGWPVAVSASQTSAPIVPGGLPRRARPLRRLPSPASSVNRRRWVKRCPLSTRTSGAVTLAWEAANSAAGSGAFFNISRKLPGENSFGPLGGSPGSTTLSRRMTFTDATVPTSAAGAGAQYIIQGQRGTLTGEPSDAVTVQFGVDGGGGEALSDGAGGLKMAA